MTDTSAVRMPTLFLSHGAPPLADDALWTRQLADWGAGIPRPKALLVVSAHWESAPPTLSPSRNKVGLTYDFWGFPQRYYQVSYDAPLAPELAQRIEKLVPNVVRNEERGLDHGAYVPLVEMYPDADVPVIQLSMPTLEPSELFALGHKLAPLRDEGVLMVGSGFTTHNLRWFNPSAASDAAPPTVSAEFDQWADEAIGRGDVDAVLDMLHKAPGAREAHPRTEHWAPLYVSLGAAVGQSDEEIRPDVAVDGFWFGLSKRSWQFN